MTRLILFLAISFAGCRTANPRVIAYLFGEADITRISAEKLTHVNYAFALVSADGRVVLGDEAPR